MKEGGGVISDSKLGGLKTLTIYNFEHILGPNPPTQVPLIPQSLTFQFMAIFPIFDRNCCKWRE